MEIKNGGEAWFKVSVRDWIDIVDSLVKPWPIAAVFTDLRYWHNSQEMNWAKIPSRARLRDRWGWTDKRVRLALKSESKWKRAKQGPTKGQARAKQGPALDTQIPVTIESRGQARAKQGPSKGQARATGAKLKNKQQRTKNKESNKRPKGLCQVSELDAVWSEINRIKGGRSLKLTKSRATALQARIKESSPDDVLAVVKWRESSTHKRAATLREGGYGIDTLLRAGKFQMYLEMTDEMSTVKPALKGKGSLEGNLMNHFFANIESQIIDVTPTKQRIE